MLYGYAGNTLRINLSENNIIKEPLSEELVDEYIGGRGFVAKTLFDELPPNTEPFDPENLFIIAMGPLSGTFMPATGKTHFGTKSPATGGYGDSNMGGHFGVEMKYAGYDMIVLNGKAEELSYIFIENDKVEVRSAQKYWGRGSFDVEKAMKDDLGEEYQILTIGPAGENLVKFACISHDFGRQAGRIGIGAVLGSKNIKAIAVRGTKDVPIYDPKGLYESGRETYFAAKEKPGYKGWTPQGTAGITDWCNDVGAMPTRNFQTSHNDYASKINGQAILDKVKITDKGCFGCPIPCGKYGYAKTSMGSTYVEGPEYETIAMLGSNCDLSDIEEIAYTNFICDELGIDTCSAGVVVSWALECYDKGIFTKEDFGMEVSFGDLKSVVKILELISHREKIGDLLAEGVRGASAKVGKGTEKFAIHVKGLEWTGYESRNAPGMMLGYMTADIGAHHGRCWVLGNDVAGSSDAGCVGDLISEGSSVEKFPKAKVKGVAPIVIESQHMRPAFDILGTCRLQYMEIGLETFHYERNYEIITGKTLKWEDLMTLSEKIWNLNRCFNYREIEDFGRKYDYPPARFYEEPIPNGPNKGHLITIDEINSMLDEFYEARGWDEDGYPTAEKLEQLGITLNVRV